MTTPELVAEVQAAGGKLWLTPTGAVGYRLPPAVAKLLAQLRQSKPEVLAYLRRLAVADSLEARMADCERRFESPALALLGLRVRTPGGTGRVVQAFTDRLAVDLGTRGVGFFAPGEVEALQ